MSPDPIKTEPIPPVTVAIIGTGDGGAPPPSGTVLQTPGPSPNLIVQVIGPLTAIFVRALNLFFVTLSGTITADAFMHFGGLRTDIIVAGAAAGVGVIKDCATVFSGLEKKFPLATGSV